MNNALKIAQSRQVFIPHRPFSREAASRLVDEMESYKIEKPSAPLSEHVSLFAHLLAPVNSNSGSRLAEGREHPPGMAGLLFTWFKSIYETNSQIHGSSPEPKFQSPVLTGNIFEMRKLGNGATS